MAKIILRRRVSRRPSRKFIVSATLTTINVQGTAALMAFARSGTSFSAPIQARGTFAVEIRALNTLGLFGLAATVTEAMAPAGFAISGKCTTSMEALAPGGKLMQGKITITTGGAALSQAVGRVAFSRKPLFLNTAPPRYWPGE